MITPTSFPVIVSGDSSGFVARVLMIDLLFDRYSPDDNRGAVEFLRWIDYEGMYEDLFSHLDENGVRAFSISSQSLRSDKSIIVDLFRDLDSYIKDSDYKIRKDKVIHTLTLKEESTLNADAFISVYILKYVMMKCITGLRMTVITDPIP